MRILLKKNIEKLGTTGDIVDVTNGYARNYLLPKKFATIATSGNIEQIKTQKKKQDKKHKDEIEMLQALANEIANISCTITVKTNQEGKLFGSVTAHNIANAISEMGYHVDEDMIVLETPIKKCDLYNIPVVLHPEVKSQCRVWIVSESEKSEELQEEPPELPSQNNPEKKKK